MKVIDPSVPRRRFWSDDVGGREVCPRCGHALINEQQTYMMVVRQGGETVPFIVGARAGYFCTECPTVVLDRDGFEEYARTGIKNNRPAKFTIFGLLDLAAIPPERQSQPIGAEGNPIPLVKFLPDDGQRKAGVAGGKPSAGKRKGKGKKRK